MNGSSRFGEGESCWDSYWLGWEHAILAETMQCGDLAKDSGLWSFMVSSALLDVNGAST